MDVAQNVGYGLRQRKIGGREEARRVSEALELVRLAGYGKRRTWELSGGQQQRVALARALVNRPTVLLLDEPLGALDLKLRKEMQLELKALQREVGITFVYVTHDQEEALTMSDVIVVMRDGRIQQQGDPTELYERPVNRFVANFIGVSNFIPGTIVAFDAGTRPRRVETERGLTLARRGHRSGRHPGARRRGHRRDPTRAAAGRAGDRRPASAGAAAPAPSRLDGGRGPRSGRAPTSATRPSTGSRHRRRASSIVRRQNAAGAAAGRARTGRSGRRPLA